MVSTLIIHQAPHHTITPTYYVGGIITAVVCHTHFEWSWIVSGLAGAVWPEFWLGFLAYFGFQNVFFERFI